MREISSRNDTPASRKPHFFLRSAASPRVVKSPAVCFSCSTRNQTKPDESRRRSPMRTVLVAALVLLGAGSALAQSNVVQNPLAAERFATLPPEADFPEGIAADPANGDIFVGTFDVKPDGSGSNFLLRFDRRGRLKAQLALGVVPTTGLAFN